MRRGGVITARRKKRERGKRMRRRALIAGILLLLCAAAMSEDLAKTLSSAMKSSMRTVQTFASEKSHSQEIVLEELQLYALQLGVYDNAEHARSEQQRLAGEGINCIIWQRDKMRLICAVAPARESLDLSAAGENEAYVVRDTLPQVHLRITCAAREAKETAGFIRLPDRLLETLLISQESALEPLVYEARKAAEHAQKAHPEHELYARLAQSMLDWCETVEGIENAQAARSYAAVMLCTIAREWRAALLDSYSLSEASTASAQRTPSTAADVMPPA